MINKEPRTLLVVDDNSTNLSVLSEFLDSSGFEVLVAVDGESAIEQLKYSLPDLILLDVMMPGIDGFETCRRLKQNPATQDIPIIFMTAVVDTASKVKGLKLGAVDYILKPFQRDEVLARINTQLRLRQEIQEKTAAQAALQALTQELEQHIEQRTAQLQLAKKEAEVASRVKSQFLESMSHELRTPLNGILGYAQILERSQTVTQEDKKGVSIIYQCGTHLLTLVNDILELATIDHKIVLYPTPFNFSDFSQSIAEIGRVRSQQKGITFVYQPTVPLPEVIEADEQRLRQVLVNLLGNAIKFTDSGRVILKIEASEPKPQEQYGRSLTPIRFQVEDTGVGMNAEQVKQIFLPFEQVGDDRLAGSGLGLAISQKIVSTMGGTIQVTSQLGVGSVFEFEIEVPEAKPLSEPILDGKIVGYRGRKQKILVVDDLRTNRLVLRNLLSQLGFEVIEANDGQEGLRKAMQLQPDLAIIDSLMPIMDGFEMMRYLRQSPQFKNVAIIASSADVFETDIDKNLKAGADAFLPKPVQLKQLLELLGKHLQLEWIYQLDDSVDDSVFMPHAQIVPPNPEMLTQLHRFAKKGDLDAIFREATQLNQTEAMRPFAQSILQFTQNFQVKKLQEFIEHYLAHHPSC